MSFIKRRKLVVLFLMLIVISMSYAQDKKSERMLHRLNKSMEDWQNPMEQWGGLGAIKLDSVLIDEVAKELHFYYNSTLSYIPWRNDDVEKFVNSLSDIQKRKLKNYSTVVYTNGYELSELIPNIYRTNQEIVKDRFAEKKQTENFITREDQLHYSQGLSDQLIALWHSHGYHFDQKLNRWEWQRARLYGTVEDIYTMSYVLPYLLPMLENAGATVFLPRERCLQTNEVIIDNDFSTGHSVFQLKEGTDTCRKSGFAYKDTLFAGDNPFQMGTSLLVNNDNGKVAEYRSQVSETGDYAVYISYQQGEDYSKKVQYTIHHSGGKTSSTVNQTMGGGTWIYLGTFHFKSDEDAVIEVSGEGTISLDAVRLGGGMGNVARKASATLAAKTSGKPRYMEAARYWMQYAGIPDTLVFSLNEEKNDYKDDYMSRGEWVNYLCDKNASGLNLPIDLAFAFHSDAGVTPNDSVIGTLGIFSTVRDKGKFPNGQSKLASRDLADIIQTQIVEDIRNLYNQDWTRRGLWDKQYSEAWRPNVPTMLLELLSHQNVADMRYGLDPNFRFDVCRAVYKGMLKFLAYQEGRGYVVQPLPVDHLAIKETSSGYELSWQPVDDPLEPKAKPAKYKVYKRVDDNGFDNGVIVNGTSFLFPEPDAGQIISYKVSAINDGGESFASEILSMGIAAEDAEKVLVVNAFDRVSAPAFIDEGDFAGIAWWDDLGVPDKQDIAFTGFQYDFNRQSPWQDDDSPGWGASYADYEGKIIKGNSFDNVYLHGQSILNAGYSFVSVSDEAFNQSAYDASAYKAIDIILGEEKTTVSYKNNTVRYKIYTPEFMAKLTSLTKNYQNVFISGAYVGSDIHLTNDTVAAQFAADILGFKWRTNHAVKSGNVYASSFFSDELTFNTEYHPDFYTVEAPDAIEPVGENAVTAFRYKENNSSAGTLYEGEYKTVVLGFPFETIISEQERDSLMKEILDFFYEEK